MYERKRDIAVVGGGLSGGLIALAVARLRPEIDVALIEAGETLGGNKRWSWFESDLPEGGARLLAPLRKTEWNEGYEVCFPAYRRRMASPYRSLASADFDAGLRHELADGAILTRCAVEKLDADGVTLTNGARIAAKAVIDCRGFAPSPHLAGGWQVFLGRYLRTIQPHGVERPIVMDASVRQAGGYRFVYVLPLGTHELLVEDTYYSDSPLLDRRVLSRRIDEYCKQHGWDGEILGMESGVLPVLTGGDFATYQTAQRIAGVAVAGARGGFAHPLTSYTLPQAVATALAIAADADRPGAELARILEARARHHWHKTAFYRRLGRMLFGAANPAGRRRVFERFYRLPEGLIERFYAARSTRLDRARILCGKPPVPIHRAMAALIGRGTPLADPTSQTRKAA